MLQEMRSSESEPRVVRSPSNKMSVRISGVTDCKSYMYVLYRYVYDLVFGGVVAILVIVEPIFYRYWSKALEGAKKK